MASAVALSVVFLQTAKFGTAADADPTLWLPLVTIVRSRQLSASYGLRGAIKVASGFHRRPTVARGVQQLPKGSRRSKSKRDPRLPA